MDSVSFKIDTNPEKYFHQLVEILRIFPPFDQLRKRQREVFAEILYQFHIFREYKSDDVRDKLVFDYKVKAEIATRLNITKGNLYNIYKELRQLNLLTKDGINRKFRFDYLQYTSITFKFESDQEDL